MEEDRAKDNVTTNSVFDTVLLVGPVSSAQKICGVVHPHHRKSNEPKEEGDANEIECVKVDGLCPGYHREGNNCDVEQCGCCS